MFLGAGLWGGTHTHMKIQTLTMSFPENLEVRVKATRRRSIFIDHTLRSQQGLFVVVLEMVVVPIMVGSCDGSGLISSRSAIRNNFKGDDGVLGYNHLTIVNLLESEGEVTGLSVNYGHVCKLKNMMNSTFT